MEKKRPNIIIIATDDQRAGTIHRLGNKDIITPNMDRLCKDGISCSHAYVPGGYTGAVCMPSRCMFHTSRMLSHLFDKGAVVPESHVLLGEVLKKNGYYCFGTGKWHNSPEAFTRAFNSGKDAFFGGMWDHWNVPLCNYDPLGNYDNRINFVANFFESNKKIEINCDYFKPGVHSSELLADTTVDFIDSYDGDKPFFIYTAFLAPHDPRTMPEKYRRLYDDVDIELPLNMMDEYPVPYDGSGMRDEELTKYPRKLSDSVNELKDYYAMITHLDDNIGRILSALDRKGIYEDTVIVLFGDNGLSLGSHGFMGKQNLYENAISVPLVFKLPGLKKNCIYDGNIYLMDTYPTLCEYLGIEIPESVEGRSYLKALSLDEDSSPRESMYYTMMDRARAVKEGRYKLTLYYDPRSGRKQTVLYDLEKDPEELEDLSFILPEVRNRLMTRLFELKMEHDDVHDEMAMTFWSGVGELCDNL